MGLLEKLKKDGTKLVSLYKYKGDVKGSDLEYKSSEIVGYGNGKGSVKSDEEGSTTALGSDLSKLHNVASTKDDPKVKEELGSEGAYSAKYHYTPFNDNWPNPSSIDEGTKAKFVAPSSPSVMGKSINTNADSIPFYNSGNTYKSQFENYKEIDPIINSRF